jgi:hypothetical protein
MEGSSYDLMWDIVLVIAWARNIKNLRILGALAEIWDCHFHNVGWPCGYPFMLKSESDR